MRSVYRTYFTKVALIWAGCSVLLFFAHMFILVPQQSSKKWLEKQLLGRKRMYSSALKAAQKETKIQLNKQIENLRNRLRSFVIDFKDSTNLTFDISRIANEKEVASFSIEPKSDISRSTTTPDYKYIFESCFDVSFLTADFNQFAALLNALERHQPAILVDRFAITRSDKGIGHQVNMNLAVFVRKKQGS